MAAKTKGIREKAESIFNKRYKLKSKTDKYSLPEANTIFSTPPFSIGPLTAIKNSLNTTKNLLNSKDIEKWRRHTSKTNPCGLVVKHLREAVKPELCTQAWVKFYEILSSCNIIPPKCIDHQKLTSLHLCEAPGAFIASLNHHIKCNFESIHWEWLASTLNPFYEGNDTKRMISGERFIIETLGRWNFGESCDGDLMQWDNLECLVQAVGGAGKVDIVSGRNCVI
jgi:cap2 methyltransferase